MQRTLNPAPRKRAVNSARAALRRRARQSVRGYFSYDAAGNRTAMTDHVGAHSFAYDDLQRLTAASHPASSPFLVQNETFSYDAVGNRQADAVRTDYAYNAGHQLTADSAYTYGYDNNGNLTTRTNKASSITANYTYDSQNRLRQAVTEGGITATYRYDVMGRRIAKTVSGGEAVPGFSGSVRYIYDNADAVALVNNSNAIGAIITHGPGVDEPLMIAAGGQRYFLLSDGLGSVVAVADANGDIKERVAYQAYGKGLHINAQSGVQTEASQIPGNIYSYTGREYDAETGFYYYRARYYDADAGRFIQKDPIGFNGGDVNLYAYVGNNPINLMDPFGLLSQEAKRIVDELESTSANSSIAWQKASNERYGIKIYNSALAEAENYLYAKSFVETGGSFTGNLFINGLAWEGMAFLGGGAWNAWKTVSILIGKKDVTPPTLRVFATAFEGATAGLASGKSYTFGECR